MRWLFIALLAGCGGGQTRVIQYAPPMMHRLAPPPVVDMSDVTSKETLALMAVDAATAHVGEQPGAKEKDPTALVREANADAEQDASDADAQGHTFVYRYTPDASFQVYACHAQNVVLLLAPGERLSSELAFGDSHGWAAEHVQTGDGHGAVVTAILMRHNSRATTQNVQMFTNVGSYDLELTVMPAGDNSCMRKVRFRHPEREMAMMEADNAKHDDVERQASSGQGCTSAQYNIEVLEGSPRWVPTMVWRTCDGGHASVHIQFRPDTAWSKIPAFKCDGGGVDYRFVPEDHVINVDGLFSRGILSLGSKETGYERVEIRALKEPR